MSDARSNGNGGEPRMSSVRVAMAQINVTVGDLEGNAKKIALWSEKAKQVGADIVAFPELALCGYPPEDLLLKRSFLQDINKALQSICPYFEGITAVVGFADFGQHKAHNAAAVIHNGSLVDVYHKVELPNYGVFDEERHFEPGSRSLAFDMNDIRFAINVCEDIWVPGSITETWALDMAADFILNISASPFYAGKLKVRQGIVRRFSETTSTTVLFNNLVGGQDELIFDGGSMVMTATGEILARACRFKEDLLVMDLEPHGIDSPQGSDVSQANTDRLYALEALGARNRKPITPIMSEPIDRIEEIHRALVLGTRDYVNKNGFKKVVIGLSGGIDSSLTAAIAVEALGSDNVVGVTMPSQYTSDATFSDAELLARNLEIRLITVPIRDVYASYLSVLAEPMETDSPGVAAENVQARIRGNILMALSNRFGWLVLTTGNKSEVAVGYCTLYGDTAGGFAVIKDVPKTTVFTLSEHINKMSGKELIPQSVIDRPPTAELRPDQKDEDSLPPYDVLDPILQAYVEADKAPEEIYAMGFDPDIVNEVIRMVDRNEYKRRQAPPGVKITPKAFGRDRRLPITNRYPGGIRKNKTP